MLRITLASACGAVGVGLASPALGEAVRGALGVAQGATESVLRRRFERLAAGKGDALVEGQRDAVSAVTLIM